MAGVKMLMKKCCDSVLIPKIAYKASIIDSIGLIILLSFFLSILSVVAWLISYPLVSALLNISGSIRGIGEIFTFLVIVLIGLGKFASKVINACSYLVNYTLKITTKCNTCGKHKILASFPKDEDPF